MIAVQSTDKVEKAKKELHEALDELRRVTEGGYSRVVEIPRIPLETYMRLVQEEEI
jgi:hypothetical protein